MQSASRISLNRLPLRSKSLKRRDLQCQIARLVLQNDRRHNCFQKRFVHHSSQKFQGSLQTSRTQAEYFIRGQKQLSKSCQSIYSYLQRRYHVSHSNQSYQFDQATHKSQFIQKNPSVLPRHSIQINHANQTNQKRYMHGMKIQKNVSIHEKESNSDAQNKVEATNVEMETESNTSIEDRTSKKNVKIIRMMNEDNDINFDPSEHKHSVDLKNTRVEDLDKDFQIEMKGEIPYSSFEEMMNEMEKNSTAVEEAALQFIEEQFHDNVVPDYIFKGLLILYNRTRQYNLQDVIYNQYFFEGSQREVDIDIVNSMVHAYLQRENINSVQDIMHQYFGWTLKNEETGEILEKEPKLFPNKGTVFALVSIAGNELTSFHLEKLLEDFKKQSHHGIIDEEVIFGFLEAAYKQLQIEDYFQKASSWMGYDGFSLTLQSAVKSVESEANSTADTTVNEETDDAIEREESRRKDLYNWIWDTYYTFYGNKMGDYAWIPNLNVLQLVMDASSIVGEASATEGLYETYFYGPDALELNSSIIVALLRSYGKTGQMRKVDAIFSKCVENSKKSPETLNSEIIQEMIDLLCQVGNVVEAVAILRKYCSSPTTPTNLVPTTPGILHVLLNGFRKLGEYNNIISLFEEFCGSDAEKNDYPYLHPDLGIVNFVIEAYVREREVDVAFQIFNEYCNLTTIQRLPTTLYALELLMQGFIQENNVNQAATLFETYCIRPESPEYCSPTVATIHLILQGLQKIRDGERSIQYFSIFFSGNIPHLYIKPQAVTLNILLQTLILDKDFKKARDVYEEYFTGEDSIEPNEETQKIMRKLLQEEAREHEKNRQYNEQLKREFQL